MSYPWIKIYEGAIILDTNFNLNNDNFIERIYINNTTDNNWYKDVQAYLQQNDMHILIS